MDNRSLFRRSATRDWIEFLKPFVTTFSLAMLAAAPIVLVATLVPHPLVLPVLSIVALIIGVLAGGAAWALGARRGGERITLWDVSGALVLIGSVAAMLSEPQAVLQLEYATTK